MFVLRLKIKDTSVIIRVHMDKETELSGLSVWSHDLKLRHKCCLLNNTPKKSKVGPVKKNLL